MYEVSNLWSWDTSCNVYPYWQNRLWQFGELSIHGVHVWWWWWWLLLYSAILRSRADSLHLLVTQHKWIAFYSMFLNIHRSVVLTVLARLVTHETAAILVQVLCTPYNHGPCHFMQKCKVYACLAVTCHLHFWQNDQDLLRATVSVSAGLELNWLLPNHHCTESSVFLCVWTEIIMTPTKKGKTTHIKIERKKRQQTDSPAIVHVAGGQHQGLVIAKNDAGSFFHPCSVDVSIASV